MRKKDIESIEMFLKIFTKLQKSTKLCKNNNKNMSNIT